MAKHDGIGIAIDDADGVLQRLTLRDGAELNANRGLDLTAQALEGGAEGKPSARAGLEEQVGQQFSPQHVGAFGAIGIRFEGASQREHCLEVVVLEPFHTDDVGTSKIHGVLPGAAFIRAVRLPSRLGAD
jgi:hypothetical protein